MSDDPVGRTDRLLERHRVIRYPGKSSEGVDRPPIFTGINMTIDPWHPTVAALLVVERKVFGGMFAADQVCILAGIKRTIRTDEEVAQITANFCRCLEVIRVLPKRISLGINAQIPGLELHDFFKVRMLPVAIGRVLINATPDRIDELTLRIEGLARHRFELALPRDRLFEAKLDDVPIEKLLDRAPAPVLVVVIVAQDLLQFRA